MVDARKLTRAANRRATGLMLVEGPNLLAEVTAAGHTPSVVFALTDAAAEGETLIVNERVMATLASTHNPRGPVAVVPIPPALSRPTSAPIVLWQVGDPGNLGTAIRSAAAFGVPAVVGPGCADPWSPKVLRAGAGAHFRTELVVAPTLDLDTISAWGYTPVAALPTGGRALEDIVVGTDDLAVLVGSEGSGLPSDVIEATELAVTIPMASGESLNAGVAASLLAYELGRRNAGRADQGGD